MTAAARSSNILNQDIAVIVVVNVGFPWIIGSLSIPFWGSSKWNHLALLIIGQLSVKSLSTVSYRTNSAVGNFQKISTVT